MSRPVQEALFGADKPTRGFRRAVEAVEPRVWPGGVRPWDPIDEADNQLGWEHTFVTPARAVAIRRELEAGRG